MSSRDPEALLEDLRQATARISANLVELEIDSVRQMLEASPLRAASAASWTRASSTLTELWRRQGLLEALLERAVGIRGFRRGGALRALLEGDSIDLGGSDVPLAERDLLGSAHTSTRCSPQELIADMAASFDEVKLVVARFGAAWDRLVPRLEAARREVAEARRMAADIGEDARRDVERVGGELEALGGAVTSDPLSVQERDVEALERSVHALHDELQGTLELKRGFDGRFLEARALLERIRTAAREVQTAQAELERKILVSADAAPAELDDDSLADELSHLTDITEVGDWREARSALERWTTRAQECLAAAEHALAACRHPLEARNQLRALLDAYQVKARRTGRLEEPSVADVYTRAHTCLYTAPTDLALAAQLVRTYQQAISEPIEVTS